MYVTIQVFSMRTTHVLHHAATQTQTAMEMCIFKLEIQSLFCVPAQNVI